MVDSVMVMVDTLRSTERFSLPFSTASYSSLMVWVPISVIWWRPLTRRFSTSAMLTALKTAAPMPLTITVSFLVLPSAPVRMSMAYLM